MEEAYCADDGKHTCLNCVPSRPVTRGPDSGESSVTLKTETKAATTDKTPATVATIGIT